MDFTYWLRPKAKLVGLDFRLQKIIGDAQK